MLQNRRINKWNGKGLYTCPNKFPSTRKSKPSKQKWWGIGEGRRKGRCKGRRKGKVKHITYLKHTGMSEIVSQTFYVRDCTSSILGEDVRDCISNILGRNVREYVSRRRMMRGSEFQTPLSSATSSSATSSSSVMFGIYPGHCTFHTLVVVSTFQPSFSAYSGYHSEHASRACPPFLSEYLCHIYIH